MKIATPPFRTLLIPAVCLVLPCATVFAATAPDWLREAAALPSGEYKTGTPAVVLHDEESVEITPSGTLMRTERLSIRVLTKEGRSHVKAVVGYNKSFENVRSFEAWVIHPSGKVERFRKKDTVDLARYSSWLELYGDEWISVIDASDGVTPDCVFGYEAVTASRSVLSQDTFHFQHFIPTIRSTYSVGLPRDWSVEGRVFNVSGVEPVTIGGRTTWTMSNLPEIPDEPLAPTRNAYGPWLAVDFRRPENAGGSNMSWSYHNWREVSQQLAPLYDEAMAPDESVRAKAAGLAGPGLGRMEKIRALAGFVQGLNYASINMNEGKGGGYIPRPATRVLACSYGDCKDKSTLLCALLKASGIESYPLVLFAGDPGRVQQSWPSPRQFNHCIVAIPVDDEVTGPAVVETAELGRLLLFDPTVHDAPVGILPWADQGGFGLVIADSKGGLVQIPSASPGQNSVERRVTARLDGSGRMTGTINEHFQGNSYVESHGEIRQNSATDYREIVEKWLGGTMPGSHVKELKPDDDFANAKLSLAIEFEGPAVGRLIRDRLMVFKPVLVARRGSGLLKPEKRELPVVFEAYSLHEVSEFELPPEFIVDEMIEPVDIEAPFGSYKAEGRLNDDGKILFERKYVLKPSVIPASDYKIVRDFYERVVEAEQSPIVLAKK